MLIKKTYSLLIITIVLFLGISNKLFSQTNIEREIKGIVFYLGAPLKNVSIYNTDTKKGTVSLANGQYSIKAKNGDLIQFSHIGLKTVSIIIEDITRQLDIKMIDQANELDEVEVIVTVSDGRKIVKSVIADKDFETSRGKIDPKRAGYAVSIVEGNEINNAYPSLSEALRGKMPGFQVDMFSGKAYLRGNSMSITQDYPVGWEVDGVFSANEPILDLSQIKRVYALRGLAATNKYGTLGAGGVIVVETHYGAVAGGGQKGKKTANKYLNKEFYYGDAKQKNLDSLLINSSLANISKATTKAQALSIYNNELKNDAYFYKIEAAKRLFNKFNDRQATLSILNEVIEKNSENPEILKASAYQMQELGLRFEAVNLYQKIFKLRPTYKQSYRDLAHSYVDYNNFSKAWRLYMSYILQKNTVSDEGIGQLIFNEMEWLYYKRNAQSNIKENFVPVNQTIEDFTKDIRFVLEWNTSEAEFDLEFVSPDQRVYTFEHTLHANESRILDEKERGYSSKDFFIDEVGAGDWLININYFGNKKNDPTFFKLTTYYNWGKPNEKKEVKVVKLFPTENKITLLKINKSKMESLKP